VKQYKYALLLTVALMALAGANAQEKMSKFFAEISLGPSFPIGQFAEKDYNGPFEKDQPGLAQVGQALNATLGYHLKENAGLLLSIGYSSNKQKPESYTEYVRRSMDRFPGEFDVESWKILKVMAGGFLITPLTEGKLNLVTKLSAGIFKTHIPTSILVGYLPDGTSYAIGKLEKEKLPVTFCYQISIGLQYMLNEKLHLLFDINSFNASAHKDYKLSVLSGGTTVTYTGDRKYKFGAVNALVGVGLNF
jgi:hypothetical protein